MKKMILFFLIIAASISGFQVLTTYINYQQAIAYYKTTQTKYVHIIESSSTPILKTISPTTTAQTIKTITTQTPTLLTPTSTPILYHTTLMRPPIEIDFAALTKVNPDIIGWIYSEDTVINYPIMYTNNNVFYLKHLMDKSYSVNGSIFLDTINQSDFSDDNSILYGHHMRNGSMFASIEKYKNQEYYDKHPYLWLLTPTQNYMLMPFAGRVVEPTRNYFTTIFPSVKHKANYIASAIAESEFTSEVAPYTQDRIISLTTCDYTFDNARFMLLCILVPCEI